MIEGERVRLKAESYLRTAHPELSGAIGTVSSLFRTNGDMRLHVRFRKPLDLIVLDASTRDFETVDKLEPRLRVV